jgi:hypothetical protein
MERKQASYLTILKKGIWKDVQWVAMGHRCFRWFAQLVRQENDPAGEVSEMCNNICNEKRKNSRGATSIAWFFALWLNDGGRTFSGGLITAGRQLRGGRVTFSGLDKAGAIAGGWAEVL